MTLKNNVCCAVDCETQDDLNNFSEQLKIATIQGKRFMFRSGASILTSLASLPPQPVAAEKMSKYVRNAKAGAVIVGSHVKKTTQQLDNYSNKMVYWHLKLMCSELLLNVIHS